MLHLTRLRFRPSAHLAACRFSTGLVWRAESTLPTPELSEGEKVIYDKLRSKFSPSHLRVQDVSGGCGSFYAITISSKDFTGMPMVKQHRLITDELKAEIEGIHGVQIKTIPQ